MGKQGLQLNFVSLLRCAVVSCIQPNYVDFAQNHLCLFLKVKSASV